MLKHFWKALLGGMASTLGAIIVTKASKALDQTDTKDWLKDKFDRLKNQIHRRKNGPV